MHSGLHLAVKAAFASAPSPVRQRSRSHRIYDADATGAQARFDDRAVAANRLRKLLPSGGWTGFRRSRSRF